MLGRDLSLAVVLTLLPVLSAQAQVTGPNFSDNFNDNSIGSQWAVVDDPVDIIEIDEANQRLEFTFAENTSANTFAGLVSNDWWFNPAEPARFKVDFKFNPDEVGQGGEIALVLGFTQSSSIFDGVVGTGVEFHYAVDPAGPFTGLRVFENGTLRNANSFVPSDTGQATVYITWNGEGRLCASLMGYGTQPDSVCFFKLFPAQEVGDFRYAPPVILFIGAYALAPTPPTSPIRAWADNFIIEEGTIVFVPTPEPEIPEEGEEGEEGEMEPPAPMLPDTGEADADDNGRVNLKDLIVALRNRGASLRILDILRLSGFQPERFTQQDWITLMMGLYNHRLLPKISPPPTAEERARAIATLIQAYAGAISDDPQAAADSGTPDANSDGFIDLDDIARMLEGPDPDPKRLLEALQIIGFDPDTFPSRKAWKAAARVVYEVLIRPEFTSSRTKKESKRDVKALLKAY